MNKAPNIYPAIISMIVEAEKNFVTIPADRKEALKKLSTYISSKQKAGTAIHLTFICTHNSRRSHIAQILAQTAAAYYQIPMVNCYSGGTEITAFNSNAVKALSDIGFNIISDEAPTNPVYKVYDGATSAGLIIYSKKYNDAPNPAQSFAAIMTCSQADESCPFVPGAEARFKLTYEDPKLGDGTPQQAAIYKERCLQIATEMIYTFHLANKA
jgi:arsenate reductase